MNEDRRYCVYVHKDLDDNIFYIGSGTEARAKSLELSERTGKGSFRGKSYSEYVKSIGFLYTYEILINGLSKQQALEEETNLFYLYKNVIVNKNKPIKIAEIDLSIIIPRVKYNPDSKSGLTWIISPVISTKIGADTAHNFQILIDGVRHRYTASRVVLELNGISTTGMVVDHIDGNPKNNSISNLKVCTQAENSRNRRKHSNNSSGYTGVRFDRRNDLWVTDYRDADGKRCFNYFSVKTYGYELAKTMAITFRENKISELSHIGYTERHGKDGI